jgi:hypothetical protein
VLAYLQKLLTLCSLEDIATFEDKILAIIAETFDRGIKEIPDLLSFPEASK